MSTPTAGWHKTADDAAAWQLHDAACIILLWVMWCEMRLPEDHMCLPVWQAQQLYIYKCDKPTQALQY